MTECKWCQRFESEKQLNTETDYILGREFGVVLGSKLFWYHKVQLWGVGSLVIKECSKG